MIPIQPDINRIIKTFNHEEPDRVPLAEVAVDFKIMSQFLGHDVTKDDLASQVEFWTKAGYDFIPITVGMMQPGDVTKDSYISKVIQRIYLKEKKDIENEDWNVLLKARIVTEKDFYTFPWEEVEKLDYSDLFNVQEYLPKGMKIIAASGKIFTLSWMLMGFENFGINLILKPQFVMKVIEKVAQIQLRSLKQLSQIPNVIAVWAVDDIAFKSGPIISPKAYRNFLFPWYEEFGKLCKDYGLYFIFHTDGLVWDLIDDLISLGIDALHPIDPTCMDIEEVKKKYGNQLCIIGNISNELLELGNPEEVADLTKHCLRTIAPGGGYCLGAGNSVPNWAKIENYRAMIETCLENGHYPIDV